VTRGTSSLFNALLNAFLALFLAISLASCKLKIVSPPSDGALDTRAAALVASVSQLVFTTPPPRLGQAGLAFHQQPVIELRDASGSVVPAPGSVSLSAFRDSACTQAAPGVLASANVATASGVAAFSGLSYSHPGALYLQASFAGVKSPCTSSVSMDDHRVALGFSDSPFDGNHACEVLPAGTVRCWGDNPSGQLGNGTLAPQSGPVAVTGISNAVQVSAGQGFSCALLSDRTVRCWGNNDDTQGAIGNAGAAPYQATPMQVTGLSNVVQIESSQGTTCAILTDRSVQCWGGGSATAPALTLTGAVSISLGNYHSCAALEDGTAWCWGNGYLGNGTYGVSATPVQVIGITNAVTVSVGYYQSCALLSTGGVTCWGEAGSGSLGDGSLTDFTGPGVAVAGISSAISVRMGPGGSACAVLSDGTVKCWGSNFYGELGLGDRLQRNTPVTVAGYAGSTVVEPSDTFACGFGGTTRCAGSNASMQLGQGVAQFSASPVTAVTGASKVVVGGYHACALFGPSGAASIQCWGGNRYGQLGDGTTIDRVSPVTVSGITTATDVAAGDEHTCAILADTSVRCWGLNADGELGVNTVSWQNPTPLDPGLTGVTAIAAGQSHTCAALGAAGGMKCWGWNWAGQLGTGNTLQQTVPAAVGGGVAGNTISKIAAGENHTCAIDSGGALYCWGQNRYYGSVGDGTSSADRTTPVLVPGSWLSVVAGDRFTCAITAANSLHCWGYGRYGEVDGVLNSQQNSPYGVPLAGGLTAAEVTAGFNHVCVKTFSNVQCRGRSFHGQGGSGNIDLSAMTPMTGLSANPAQISARGNQTCVRNTAGTVQCYGWNGFGQLGTGSTFQSSTPLAVP
jgi:alpha-tubulin suppressor-like RCC1 family protein